MKEKQANTTQRSPVVVVLGHVDHGKTSLLDAIRNTSIQSGESGGITQNIYISDVVWKDKHITFVDTPGHEVFSLMRINGGKVADIAFLIVAADESVKPQTIESIEIITAQKIPYIVVITKSDKPEANPEKVKNDLISKGVYLEGYGGDIPFVEVSAHSKKGLDQLLDLVFLFTEVENILNDDNAKIRLMETYGELADKINTYGVVLDSSLDKALGKTVFGVLKYGSLKKGDTVFIGSQQEKVGMLFDPQKKGITEVLAGQAFIMTGLKELPASGVDIVTTDAISAMQKFYDQQAQNITSTNENLSEADLLESIFADETQKVVPLIVRTDVKASLQSIIPSLKRFDNEGLVVKVVSSGVGAITTNDIDLAKTFNALLLGFRVAMPSSVKEYAKQQGVTVSTFDVVYHLYDFLNESIQKVLGKGSESGVVIGTARVKQIFTLSDGSVVAGSVVTDGELKKSALYRVVRNGVALGEYPISSLRVLKDERSEVKKGSECGINFGKEVDVQAEDIIEAVAKTA